MTLMARRACHNDAGALARLNLEFNGGEQRETEDIIRSLNTGKELVAVAVLLEEIVGFACAQKIESFCYPEAHGEITEMYVSEGVRRRGAASALIACLEQELSRQGVRTIRILTGSMNYTALRAYENNGYAKRDEAVLMKQLL